MKKLNFSLDTFNGARLKQIERSGNVLLRYNLNESIEQRVTRSGEKGK
ncbi:MAG: hypothetical protein M0Q44_12280 [Methylobacter sp.]|jgi:hypothetical protein|nr:hypothetical protein [Methylobacter sp.]